MFCDSKGRRGQLQQFTNTSGFFLHHLLLEFSDPVTAPPFIAQVWIRMILLSIPKITPKKFL